MITALVGFYCFMWGMVGTLGYSMGALKFKGVKHWKEALIYFSMGFFWWILIIMMFWNRKK